MRISMESFYVRGFTNINNLWYEDGSFSVQRGNGSLFRISEDNTDKNLRGISPEQVEKINKTGYFTIFESLGFSGKYSIKYTCRLLGGGNGPSHESNDSPSNSSSSNSNDYACAHNDRPGVSIADIAEHAGNLNFGSAGRDVMDLVSGHESFGGFNQAPSSGGESSSSNSSSADTSKTG